MKRLLFAFGVVFAVSAVQAQGIKVLTDSKISDGFAPHFTETGVVTYLTDDHADYPQAGALTAAVRVDNEDLTLNLYCNGRKTVLTPDGSDVNYIWSSLSPNGQMILYNTRRGTAVCDLNGAVLYRLGQLDAPVWYGNDYVVGMHDYSDGHQYTASSLAIVELSTGIETALPTTSKLAMYPAVDATRGRIAYDTPEGEIRLIQLNISDEPITGELPVAVVVAPEQKGKVPSIVPHRSVQGNRDPKDVRIYINPGHGGHWSNDRNMTIHPFKSGDVKGFWESNSNLDKGLMLDSMLHLLGFQTQMSRRTNNDGGGNDKELLDTRLSQGTITKAQYDDMLANGDDRSLSAIVAEANAYKADFMLSIHSNAGGPANYILQLYAGIDQNDPQQHYPTATPCSDESRAIATEIANNQYTNTITPWSATPNVTGDKTFGRTAMKWSDGYGVLRRLTVPGTISEGMMHDYVPNTYRMMNMDYKHQEAWFFTRAFYRYFCGKDLTTGVIGGQVRDMNNKQLFPDIKRIAKTNDVLEPLCGATVELRQGDQVLKTYQTDALYNGVFFFWDLTPGTYTIRAKKDGYYDLDKEVVVAANTMYCEDMLLSLVRSTPLEVVSYSPCPKQITDSIEVGEKIVLNFNWDVWEEPTRAAFSISPAVEGTIEFSNSQRTMTFIPSEALTPGEEYTVTLAKSACHPDTNYSNTLREDFVLKFRTKNRSGMRLVQSYPAAGDTDIPLKPTIMLMFDAKVGPKTATLAAKEFQITDDGGFSFAPAGRNLVINKVPQPYGSVRFDVTKALQPNTTYTIIVTPELADINNVHPAAPITILFTTGSVQVVVPKGEMLNAMDTLFLTPQPEKCVGVGTLDVSRAITTVNEGSGANRIQYTFVEADDTPALMVQPMEFYNFRSTDRVGMDVYGDLSYNDLYLEFITEGDVHLIYLGTLDYVGWRHMSVDLVDLPASVDFSLSGIKVVKGSNILSGSGDIFLDRLMRCPTSQTALGNATRNLPDVCKYIENGTMYIERDGIRYGIIGEVIK